MARRHLGHTAHTPWRVRLSRSPAGAWGSSVTGKRRICGKVRRGCDSQARGVSVRWLPLNDQGADFVLSPRDPSLPSGQ
jgi:hypothetical protein